MKRQRTLEEQKLSRELNELQQRYDTLSNAYSRLSLDYTVISRQYIILQDNFENLAHLGLVDFVHCLYDDSIRL